TRISRGGLPSRHHAPQRQHRSLPARHSYRPTAISNAVSGPSRRRGTGLEIGLAPHRGNVGTQTRIEVATDCREAPKARTILTSPTVVYLVIRLRSLRRPSA